MRVKTLRRSTLSSTVAWPVIAARSVLPRLVQALTLWMVALSALRAGPDCVVTFNEIAYAPTAGPEWIELHNQFSVKVDVGGWKLTGGSRFTIPEGTVIEPGGYLVLSAQAGTPAGALGPLDGALDNQGETLQLETRHGRTMDTLDYRKGGDWVDVDSVSETLSKRLPGTRSDKAASWARSAQPGGTPGAENFPATVGDRIPVQRMAFSPGSYWKYEAAGAAPATGWMLYGFDEAGWGSGPGLLGSAAVAGSVPVTTLPLRPTHFFRKAFVLPGGIPSPELMLTARLRGEAWVYLDGVEIGHLPPAHGTVSQVFRPATLTLGSHQLAVRVQQTPGDAGSGWDASLTLLSHDFSESAVPMAGPGAVAISEILYHHRPTYRDEAGGVSFAENPEEFVELHNRSLNPVDLSGMKLADAISYTFPPGTILPPNGYLTVTNAQFSGSLSDGGEHLELKSGGTTLSSVTYSDGGRWPKAADGGGSSLELIDPNALESRAEAWAASRETAPWQTITYRAAGTEPPNTNNPDTWHEFLFGMLDDGEVLVDDVSVIEDPDGAAIQVIQNGGFEADNIGQTPAKWRCLGTHRLSTVVANPDGAGKVLKIVATAEMEHTYNCCSTTLVGNRAINPAKTYQIGFKARWLSGSPQLNSRLYLNRCARTSILQQPATTGTPGQPNSRAIANAGPTFDRLRHGPLVPTATQAIRISCEIGDVDGVSAASVFYRVNGAAWQETAMAAESGQRHVGIVPGQTDGALVQFYVQARDGAGQTSVFPAAGPDSRALIRVGEGGAATASVGTKISCLMLPAEAAALHEVTASVSNFRWGCTVIDGNDDVYYDAGVRLRSAPFGRQGTRAGWNISFPANQPFRGVHGSIVVDGAFNMPKGDGTGWLENSIGPSVNEMLYQAIANRSGDIPSSYDDICWFEAPISSYSRLAQLKLARFNNSFLDSYFDGNDGDGSLYKQELIYYPTTTVDGNPESLKNGYNQVRDLDVKYLGPSSDSYRFTYLLQNHTDRDDFSRIVAMGQSFDAPAAELYAQTSATIDADNWMRVLALNALVGLADTYNQGLAHNMMFYARPSDGRVLLMPWDQDHAFYYATNSNIFGIGSHRAAAIVAVPQNKRLFCGHLLHLCQTGFRNEFLDAFITNFSQTAQRPGYAYNLKQWVANRRAYVLQQLAVQHPAVSFAITTNGGADFSVAASSVTLAGNGWIDVAAIRLDAAGVEVPVTWTSGSQWQIVLPLAAGANAIQLSAIDRQGLVVGTDAITVTNTGPVAANAGNLVVSEFNYHPPDPNGATLEFIELQNIGSGTIDLTGVAFSAGIEFAFPTGFTIASHGYALVVQNTAAFSARYGTGLPIAGEWSTTKRLGNGGDRIVLVDRVGATIRDFTYSDLAPWPVTPDGQGPTVVLLSPLTNPDHSLGQNWAASAQSGGSPGAADAASQSLALAVQTYLIELPHLTAADGEAVIRWTVVEGAPVQFVPQISDDLVHWRGADGPGSPVNLTSTTTPEGTVITAKFLQTEARRFFRLVPGSVP